MWPAKNPIEIKACAENVLHHIRHALTHDEFHIEILSFDLKQ